MGENLTTPKNIYNCYIDESGDEGLESRPWFVLSAVVVDVNNEKTVKEYEGECKQKVWLDNKMPCPASIHWKARTYPQRKAMARILVTKPYIQIVVGIWKPKLDENSGFSDRNILFRYASKLLLERISWLVDSRHGWVNITFSNRGGFDLCELQRYISLISNSYGNQIKPVFDPMKIKVLNSSGIVMLRTADNCASTFGNAFNPDDYGGLNPECANMLQVKLYRRGYPGKLWGYGLKVFPSKVTQKMLEAEYPFIRDWF